jgi:hypothetical protein
MESHQVTDFGVMEVNTQAQSAYYDEKEI